MKIHDALIQAIRSGTPLNQQNTIYGSNRVYLHGNLLSNRSKQGIYLCDGNYPSRTTLSRLKTIIEAYNLPIEVRYVQGNIYFKHQGKIHTKEMTLEFT